MNVRNRRAEIRVFAALSTRTKGKQSPPAQYSNSHSTTIGICHGMAYVMVCITSMMMMVRGRSHCSLGKCENDKYAQPSQV